MKTSVYVTLNKHGNGLAPSDNRPLTEWKTCGATWSHYKLEVICQIPRPYQPLNVFLTIVAEKKWSIFCKQTYSNLFSSMKIGVFWFKFYWNMFSRVQFSITQYWFRSWIGAKQATSYCLNQGRLRWRIHGELGSNELSLLVMRYGFRFFQFLYWELDKWPITSEREMNVLVYNIAPLEDLTMKRPSALWVEAECPGLK